MGQEETHSSGITAQDYISSQNELEREAKELMPYDPNTCTYSMGPIRQQIYACLTCLESTKQLSGVCYSCSIQCHHDHNLVELFTKRNFNCDCGTTRTQFPCSLRSNVKDDIPQSDNRYNQNYNGVFCNCSQIYNPLEEKSNMLQCIFGDVCNEDWYHDYCIMGLDHYDPEEIKTEKGVNKLDDLGEPEEDAETQNEINKKENDQVKEEELENKSVLGDKRKAESEATSQVTENKDSEEPEEEPVLDGFPSLDDFDCYICWKCINAHKAFFEKIKSMDSIVLTTVQRIESKTLGERNDKILQNESGGLLSLKKRKIYYDYSIFLKHDHESNFAKLYETTQDQEIKKFLDEFTFLKNDDPIYEPPPDDDNESDDNSSIYDLGARAINNLPREQAIEGVQAYQQIKDKLKNFLTPFAQEGKIVGEDDVKKFFENIKK